MWIKLPGTRPGRCLALQVVQGVLRGGRNETGFGGNNGFTNFRSILGFGITEPGTRAALLFATVLLLVLLIGCLLGGKFGVGTVIYALSIGPLIQLCITFMLVGLFRLAERRWLAFLGPAH